MEICIVAHNAYGMIAGDRSLHIGGVELQATMMARWLAAKGHGVSLITWDEGGPKTEYIDDIRIIKTCKKESGIAGVRFFVPRWSSLVKALQIADADIYYQNGAEYVTGQVAFWCRWHARKFVFSAASDLDCQREIQFLKTTREILLYRYGLRKADRVIVQTRNQRASLRSHFQLSSTVLPMPCMLQDSAESARRTSEQRREKPLILAVCRVSKEKNLEMFIEVARILPQFDFLIVGPGKSGDSYFSSIAKLADAAGNVGMHGAASREELSKIYELAAILCCTSHYEGFPNTFLEAWSHGIPIVSTVDPDSVIRTNGLGFHVSTSAEMARQIQALIADSSLKSKTSETVRKYFHDVHSIDNAMSRFENEFLDVLAQKDR